jgi:hypothetical protein
MIAADFQTNVQYPQIERRHGLTEREFSGEYKRVGRPIVLLDAANNWEALHWTFEFLRRKYGTIQVDCSRYESGWYAANDARRMSLADFIDGVTSQDWKSFPFYIRDYWALFERHPELLSDCPVPTYFFNWMNRMPAFMRRPGPRLFEGPRGAVTPLHADIWGTHAWMTQIVGRKRWILIPPYQAHLLGKKISLKGGLPRYAVNPENPDHERFPLFAQATPVEAVVSPSETIFVPGGWFHHVVSLDAGISITDNFMGPGCFRSVLPNSVNDLVLKRIMRKAG